MITTEVPDDSGSSVSFFRACTCNGKPGDCVERYATAMIDQHGLTALLRRSIPDAQVVRFDDLTGGGDHLSVHIRSSAFAGRTLLDQHRLVYAAVDDAMRDGRIHALQMKTEILETPA